jgi:hypothetical protein
MTATDNSAPAGAPSGGGSSGAPSGGPSGAPTGGPTGGGRVLLRGRAWTFGRDVDTDCIIPARYLNMKTADELAVHAMEDLDPEFAGDRKSVV